jgi:hypothetical protein
VQDFIYKSKVDNHQQIKQTLIEQINLIPKNPIMHDKNNILHTDWKLPMTMERKYSGLFMQVVSPHLEMIRKELDVAKVVIDNFWFQIYEKGGEHDWHTHTHTHFSNVYYLECPKGAGTEFKNLDVQCEEGEILSFPAFLPHRSPPLLSDVTKTIIAFNCSFDYDYKK